MADLLILTGNWLELGCFEINVHAAMQLIPNQ